ncbi:hypothetical protein CEE37_10350 [candidate division LCP-89 bacterium B3_LCP]|uniref:Secretion system C-terminal sorting domain-containing protein n=1 Tax=candidate division LCP-89 bacterium B3_LCP TaxID=2012998 RepID=A0A532UZG4_UNCL8|nr:MAG: hypothetical protein CEE37_10350 [candidate division LCP-89 bacterium B3_LCP]
MGPQFPYGGGFNVKPSSPCIDAGDPAHPNDPDGTIADQGALPIDQNNPTMAVTINLTPAQSTIYVLPGGSSFDFSIAIENVTTNTQTVDVWTMAQLPNGAMRGPIILREDIELPAGMVMSRDLNQYVPGSAPGGSYTYFGFVGIYPGGEDDLDGFNFLKFGDGDGAGNAMPGWSFDGWDTEPVSSVLPTEVTLSSAYPNPFNPQTTLSFSLPEAGQVTLIVYDVSGREVARLYDGWYAAGEHQAVFNGGYLASGLYIAKLTSANSQLTQKLMLVK